MTKRYVLIVALLIALLTISLFYGWTLITIPSEEGLAAVAAIVPSPFNYLFNKPGTLYESGNMDNTSSPYWWLNSGAKFIISSTTGQTVHGDLLSNDTWKILYARNNPLDTDAGLHPQNIFRLVSRNTWHNFRQQVYYKIDKDQLSVSPNRNESNGLLLFNRYEDSQNLYYTGIRVDGAAVIKKKINGVYYTMAYKKIFPGNYNKLTSPNLLPHSTWVGLRSEVLTSATGTVMIKLYTDVGETGNWQLVATAYDNGKDYGGKIIDGKAFVGMRTDFMDVSFKKYRIEEII